MEQSPQDIIAITTNDNDEDRYVRVIIKCFITERLERISLSSLPSYFKKYYGRHPKIDSKLSTMLQKPLFQKVCRIKKTGATWVEKSQLILSVLARKSDADPKEFNQNSINNANTVNNINQQESSKNPFALLAKREMSACDQNDESRFGQLVSEELNCGICFDLLKEAVESDCCRNLFCWPCIEQNGRKCPNCRKLVEWTANEPIRRMVAKKPIQCDYKGCKAWSTVGDIEQHWIKCEFNPVNTMTACQKCQRQIMRRLMEEHLDNTCEMNKAHCQNCDVTLPRKDLLKHETEDCEFRRVACSHGCGEHMIYCDRSYHNKTCTHLPINCTNQKCRQIIQRRHLSTHLQVCEYTMIARPNQERGCQVTYEGSALATMNNCLRMCRSHCIVDCSYGCNKEMQKRQIENYDCDHLHEECPMCEEVKRLHLQAHIKKFFAKTSKAKGSALQQLQDGKYLNLFFGSFTEFMFGDRNASRG
jgi:hypothetical protein